MSNEQVERSVPRRFIQEPFTDGSDVKKGSKTVGQTYGQRDREGQIRWNGDPVAPRNERGEIPD